MLIIKKAENFGTNLKDLTDYYKYKCILICFIFYYCNFDCKIGIFLLYESEFGIYFFDLCANSYKEICHELTFFFIANI